MLDQFDNRQRVSRPQKVGIEATGLTTLFAGQGLADVRRDHEEGGALARLFEFNVSPAAKADLAVAPPPQNLERFMKEHPEMDFSRVAQ